MEQDTDPGSTVIDSSFVRVKCDDCGNEQVTFLRTATQVDCQVCGSILAEPTGGKARLHGEVIEQLH